MEPRQEDSQIWNRESERLIDKHPNKQHHEIKRFNIYRSKISLWKNRGSPEDHWQKVKTRMGTQIRIADKKKKDTTTSKNTESEPPSTRLATEMKKCIQKIEIPEWMTKRKNTLIKKEPLKETA